MARLNPLMILPPALFAGLAGLFFFGMYREDPQGLPSTFIGQVAPVLPDETLPGETLLTAETLAGGEVSIVNFWASWCPPCRAEHPTLLDLDAQGLPVYGVNFKDELAQAQKYLADYENPFGALGFDPRGRFAIEWGVTAPPETFIIDGDGTVLFKFAGPLVGSDYEQRFLPALQEALAAAGS
ncbi:DsbE family thiol:disulfide interchange protein [Mesobacterium pallidum]|uniref:DsbE family thiol:disulfide interchange protein n=1 Tax=Mesobacterium pallidum TaxID=2872037 RepID=UPI001EE28EF8|nr:DsbE family thiol:disulfide interchange protein [Mesobacterium pallidum]